MRLKHLTFIGALLLVLSACGRPDSFTSADATPSRAFGNDIASLLRNPPAPGVSVEVDAYVTRIGSMAPSFPPGSGIDLSCPVWVRTLTDRPFSGSLGGESSYPPDNAPVLFIHDSVPELPFHARLRGHLGDRAFAHCTRAERIFAVERVVTVYEQTAPNPKEDGWRHVPENYAAWPRHHDANLGYSFAYPPNWRVEPLQEQGVLAAVAVRGLQWPDYPLVIRVYDGEVHADPFDPAAAPPLLKGASVSTQDEFFTLGTGKVDTQHLAGYYVIRNSEPTREDAMLFSAHGRTYELSFQFPTGMDASQVLMTLQAGIIASFRLDVTPEPSPTPPVKQELGAGPFLTQEQAFARARELTRQEMGDITLLEARLVSEAEARRQMKSCIQFNGHPDGTWLLTVRATYYGAIRTVLLILNATTGEELCGEEIGKPTPLPTLAPYPAPASNQRNTYPAPAKP